MYARVEHGGSGGRIQKKGQSQGQGQGQCKTIKN